MSSFIIKKASRKSKKLKIGFSGPSYFGKTYSALLVASGLVDDWSEICVVDTEKDSASLYSDLGQFDTIDFRPPYSPERYIEAIRQVEKAGYKVCILDSISHEWAGQGGCLDIHHKYGGTFNDWGKVTPRHNKFIDAIIDAKMHVFVTMRKKQDYEVDTSGGRYKVRKVGLGEIQRGGFEYELDINFNFINENHMVELSKNRTGLFEDLGDFVLTSEHGKQLKEWCSSGASNLDEAMAQLRKVENSDQLVQIYKSYKRELGDNPDFIASVKKKKEYFKSIENKE